MIESTKKILSGQLTGPELYALSAAGYEPIGICIGVAAISMGSRGFGRSIQGLFKKGEMTAVSQTSTDARKLAIKRAEEEATELGADLFLVHNWEIRDAAEIMEVTCSGTACRRVGEFKEMQIATATS